MNRFLFRLSLCCLVCLLAVTLTRFACGQSGFGGLGGLGGLPGAGSSRTPVVARAAWAHEPLSPDHENLLIVELKIDRRYHIQSAAAALPYRATRITVQPYPGLAIGDVRYPVSIAVPAPPGFPGPNTIAVYEGTVYIEVPVTVQSGADLRAGMLQINLLTQACDAISCLPPDPTTLTLAVKTTGTPATPDPVLLAAAEKQAYATAAVASASAPTVGTTTSAPAATIATPSDTPLLSDAQQLTLIDARPYVPANSSSLSLLVIAFSALVGGMILNVMPCVLPVIPLKVLSLVQQAHGDRRIAIQHSVAFSAGVITLFVALAIALKSLGLFYGQQFQSSAFLIAMILFVVALALSMLGVWAINPPQALYAVDARLSDATQLPLSNSGAPDPHAARHLNAYIGSFANGLMATLLATPCSAPFLGGALAWALVQPTYIAALTLGLVGVGMSLPYLLLAAFPALLKGVPRAGRWSELLKQGLGIVMLGVAVYLVQLVPQVQLWPWVMLGAVTVALVCWAWGQIPTAMMSVGRVWSIRIVALVIGAALGLGIYALGARAKIVMFAQHAQGQWQPFNVALLDAALAEGRPVVVDWTADWCINCRVLDAAVLSTDAVQTAFHNANALLLRADLSEDNPPATALNAKLGGRAIPVLAIFSPAQPFRPVVLRDSYGSARVIDEVGRTK